MFTRLWFGSGKICTALIVRKALGDMYTTVVRRVDWPVFSTSQYICAALIFHIVFLISTRSRREKKKKTEHMKHFKRSIKSNFHFDPYHMGARGHFKP